MPLTSEVMEVPNEFVEHFNRMMELVRKHKFQENLSVEEKRELEQLKNILHKNVRVTKDESSEKNKSCKKNS